MDKIPLMGFTRGIFEIFVPGVFLLLNFYFALYMTPYTSETLKNLSSNINEIILALIIFSFSYLLGVILRLLRAETVDRWSGSFLFLLEGNESAYITDKFPYGNFNKNYYKRLNLSEIQEFRASKWKIVVNDSLPFNFIKTMLICEDEVAAKEIYAAESLSRYVAGMLYCLVISNLTLLCVIGFNFFINKHNLFLILVCIILVWYCVIRWWCYRQYRKYCKMYRISVDTGYDLSLKRVDTVDGLANEGRKLVIVALVGTNLHIRIFDANRKRIVDKAENELMRGETLTTLKKQLNLLPDESRLSQEQKQKIIRNATSIAGHNLNSYYLRIFWFILRIFWFIFLFLVCGIILYGLEDKDRFIGLVFTVYLLGIFAILYNFRVIRHKEVHIVFALAFKYQERLFSSKGSDVATQSGNEKQQSG